MTGHQHCVCSLSQNHSQPCDSFSINLKIIKQTINIYYFWSQIPCTSSREIQIWRAVQQTNNQSIYFYFSATPGVNIFIIFLIFLHLRNERTSSDITCKCNGDLHVIRKKLHKVRSICNCTLPLVFHGGGSLVLVNWDGLLVLNEGLRGEWQQPRCKQDRWLYISKDVKKNGED
jgi:hypothetical protein